MIEGILCFADSFRPATVLLENVIGLYKIDDGKTLNFIMLSLAQLGYHVSFQSRAARHILPQRRDRIIILAVRADLARPSHPSSST